MTATIITFRPRSSDWEQNLRDYIATAKALPFLPHSNIVWDSPRWDLSGLAKPNRPGTPADIVLSGGRSKLPGLSGLLGDFARAFIAFEVARRPGETAQIGLYAKPILMLRRLAQQMQLSGISSPTELIPEIFDDTVRIMTEEGKSPNTVSQNSLALSWIARALTEARITQEPFDWDAQGIQNKRYTSRLNSADSSKKNLNNRSLEKAAEAFVRAETPREQIMTSIFALLCCAPMRISEVLSLTADCDALLDPGDGYQAGLRWRPAKGGAPHLKFIPKAMLPVAKTALAHLKKHTEAARELARQGMAAPEVLDVVPPNWPNVPDLEIPFASALCVVERGALEQTNRSTSPCIEPITYHKFMRVFRLVLQEMGVGLTQDEIKNLTTHQPRHYLNTIAQKASVPQADIALWSGRKSLAQNAVYDHETAEELVERFRSKSTSGAKRLIPVDDQETWTAAQIKETAHTTPFGWCTHLFAKAPVKCLGPASTARAWSASKVPNKSFRTSRMN
jgi:integrase